jgi:hypothetical protein
LLYLRQSAYQPKGLRFRTDESSVAGQVVYHDDEKIVLELEGALTAMLDAAQAGAGVSIYGSSIKVVAGARNSRFLRLVESVIPRLVA